MAHRCDYTWIFIFRHTTKNPVAYPIEPCLPVIWEYKMVMISLSGIDPIQPMPLNEYNVMWGTLQYSLKATETHGTLCAHFVFKILLKLSISELYRNQVQYLTMKVFFFIVHGQQICKNCECKENEVNWSKSTKQLKL